MLLLWTRVLTVFIAANTWVCNKANLSEKTLSDMCFWEVSVHGASKETAVWKKYKMKASGVSVTVRCYALNIQKSACLLFFFVWCLLRCSNTSVWHESKGWTLTDRRRWNKCHYCLESSDFQTSRFFLYHGKGCGTSLTVVRVTPNYVKLLK